MCLFWNGKILQFLSKALEFCATVIWRQCCMCMYSETGWLAILNTSSEVQMRTTALILQYKSHSFPSAQFSVYILQALKYILWTMILGGRWNIKEGKLVVMWPKKCGTLLPSESSQRSTCNLPEKGLSSYWCDAVTLCLNLREVFFYIRILCPWAFLNSVWQVTSGERDNGIFVFQSNSTAGDWNFLLSYKWSFWCCEVLNSLWSQWFRRWGLHHVSGLGSFFWLNS